MNTIAERLARGFQLQRAGQLEEAYQLFRGILVDAPQNIDALHAVGLLLHQVGRHTEALDFLCQALVLHGPHPMIHSNLGAVYLKTRQPGEAATHCRAAIRLLPDLAIAHFNLGAALRHLDQLEEAEVAFRQAVRLSPTDVDALSNLGVVLHKLGRSLEALIHLENAVRLAPSHAQARFDLGSVLIATNEPEAGLEHLREICGNAGIMLRRFSIGWHEVAPLATPRTGAHGSPLIQREDVIGGVSMVPTGRSAPMVTR